MDSNSTGKGGKRMLKVRLSARITRTRFLCHREWLVLGYSTLPYGGVPIMLLPTLVIYKPQDSVARVTEG